MYTLPANGTMVAKGWDANGNYPSRRPSSYSGGEIENHTGFAYNVRSDGSFTLFANQQTPAGAPNAGFTITHVLAHDAANYNVVLAPSEQPYNSYKESGYVVAPALSITSPSASQSGNPQSVMNPFTSIFNSIGNLISGQGTQGGSSSSPVSKGGCGN
jgi:hypothetical protein